MPSYSYKVKDPEGKTVTGLVEAATPSQATKLLREKHFFVISLRQMHDRLHVSALARRLKKVSFRDVINFTRQLATMVVAGLTLPEALTILRTQTTNPAFARVLLDIEHHIVGGGNLAGALERYPSHFSPIYIALVRAGEASGTLDQILSRLAETMEAQGEFRSKVVGALIYPAIIMVGMVVVMVIMMTVVIPKLTEMYSDFGITLPMATRILIAVSMFFVNFWWVVGLLAVCGVMGFQKFRKTSVGERILDTFILRLPLIGELQKKVILVEFTRTFAMLIAAGIHVLEGLGILRDSLGNVLFRDAVNEITKKIERGFPMGDTFAQYEVFPPIVSQMMKVGEETGKLDDTLSKLSRYFETESDHLLKGLTAAIEPIIMVVLGLGVGFIVMSVVTPIYNLTSQFK